MAIYLPSTGADGWQRLLAEPTKHWKTGYSARAVAHSWESASGLPPEIDTLLGGETELLLAVPEHKVPLPGGGRASQCDVFALAKQRGDTIAIAVEGKVNEPFGPTVGEWLDNPSEGRIARLTYIATLLGKTMPLPPDLRYQLFHRTAAAIIEGRRFKTDRAAMIIHSFSQEDMWFGAFSDFCAFLGVPSGVNTASIFEPPDGPPLTIGWARGDKAFLLS